MIVRYSIYWYYVGVNTDSDCATPTLYLPTLSLYKLYWGFLRGG